ncbi:MAG TPA: hypothetical protein V6C52_03160 [Coleofasciculaceae cyanobacterium]|jgi:hypothetical protein
MPVCHAPNKCVRISGQSLSEYVMIGAIIVVIGIGAYFLLGGALKDVLAGVKGSMSGNIATAQQYSAQTTSSTAPTGYPEAGVINTAGGPLTISIDGATVTLSDYPANMQESIQTVGANGTTKSLALALSEMAQQLLDQGKITQDQFAILKNLSNSGHTLAKGMAIVEGAADEAAVTAWTDKQKIQKFASDTGEFNDKERKISYVAYQLSNLYIYDVDGNIIGRTALGKFTKFMNQANKDKTLPPGVKDLVAQLSAEIKLLSKETGSQAKQVTAAASNMSIGLVSSTGATVANSADTVEALSESTDSVTVNTDSSHICVAGHWQDTGEACGP